MDSIIKNNLDFTRRRYGNQTYTWVYVKDKDGKYHSTGDPYPKIVVSRKELEQDIQRLINNGIIF